MPPVENIYDCDEGFWRQYLKGRPQVPDSFFHRIFSYHEEHHGEFDTVHEPGAGVGIHTARLASRFRHVIVSDPAERNIEVAKTRLQTLENCEYLVAKMESKAEVSDGCADMAVVLNAIHFTHVDQAVETLGHQLKSGGTLAVAAFGLSVLGEERAQAIWVKIWQRGSEVMIEHHENLEGILEYRLVVASAYDAIALPESLFLPGAVRMRIDYKAGASWYQCTIPPSQQERFPSAPSRVSPSDRIVDVDDDTSWRSQADLAKLKDLISAFTWGTDQSRFSDLWSQMEATLGGRTISVHWPVSLILATRK